MVQSDGMADAVDRHQLALLASNARLPISSLALTLGIGRATTRARIERLERDGVIAGYTLRAVNDEKHGVRAMTKLRVTGRSATGLLKSLKSDPEVVALRVTNGRWNIVVQLAVAGLGELEMVLRSMRTLDGVLESDTSILLSRKK